MNNRTGVKTVLMWTTVYGRVQHELSSLINCPSNIRGTCVLTTDKKINMRYKHVFNMAHWLENYQLIVTIFNIQKYSNTTCEISTACRLFKGITSNHPRCSYPTHLCSVLVFLVVRACVLLFYNSFIASWWDYVSCASDGLEWVRSSQAFSLAILHRPLHGVGWIQRIQVCYQSCRKMKSKMKTVSFFENVEFRSNYFKV